MPWILYDVLAAATYNVIDPSKAVVSCDLLKLNESRVICASPNPVNVDREVKVIDQVVDPETKVVVEEHTLIHGYIQKYAQMTKGITNSTYEYTIKELASELDKFRVHSGTNYVVNCSTQNTSLYAATIFVDSAWSAATSVTNYIVKALQFRYMTGIAALNKIVSELSAASAATPLYMWFDSSAKTVGWGEYRTDRTAGKNFTKGTYYNYKEEKTVRNQVAGVVIYGANSAYDGHYPDPLPGSQHDLAVYQYDTATSDLECADIAKAVYLTWCADPKRRIQFVLRPADTKVSGQYILEGDRIQVDGSTYTVIDMTYSPKEVLIGVNAGQDSALYSLGDKLRPIAGSASGATEVVWTPGVQNVSSDGTTKSKFVLDISSPTDISDSTVMLNVEIGPYKAYSYQNAVAANNSILSKVTVPSGFSCSGVSTRLAPGETVWIPIVAGTSYLETASPIADGFQYALATINFIVMTDVCDANPHESTIYILAQYSYNGTVWFDGTYQSQVWTPGLLQAETLAKPVSNTYSIPGILGTTKVYVRWRIWLIQDFSDRGYWLDRISGMLDVFPRHSHDFQQTGIDVNKVMATQTDDLTEVDVTPPGTVTCLVNGNSHSVSNNTPFDIKDHLISGKNSIEFTSTTVCTVTPSTHFMMFG